MSETLPHKYQEYDQQLRDRNDIETWLAEVLDGSMRTEFTYRYDGEDLRAEDGSSMGPVFAQATVDAEHIANNRPDLAFEFRRRLVEGGEYEDMLDMAKGQAMNTMVVVSDFPAELMDQTVDVGGYNTRRKQTMLRVVMRDEITGALHMVTQSLDRSDRHALEKIYHSFGLQPSSGELLGQRVYHNTQEHITANELADRLTQTYDQALSSKYGGQWNSGRNDVDRRNTHDFVRSQIDLVDTYLHGDQSVDQQRNIAAAMQQRFNRYHTSEPVYQFTQYPSHIQNISVAIEMELAGRQAAQEGRVFSGCGASIGGSSTNEQLAASGYGNKTTAESSGDKDKNNNDMRCVNCPSCGTFHDKVRTDVKGKPLCDNEECSLHG